MLLKSVFVWSGVSLTAAMIGGCSAVTPGPVAQVLYCDPGYELRSDRLCWPRPPPAASYDDSAGAVVDDPPPAAPEPHGTWDNWGRDAAITAGAVGGIEAGKYALSKLRNGAAERAAGTVARAVPRLAAPVAEDGLTIMIERGAIWVAEHPWVLLELSYKSQSPEPWRGLVSQPGYASRTAQKS